MSKRPLLLVVDDDVDITGIYSIFFDLRGFDVLTAHDPVQALQLLVTRVPDLIISDCVMPYMDGIDFAASVKASPTTKHVPIILMSGVRDQYDLDKSTCELFLRKPVLFAHLLPHVLRLLGPQAPSAR